MKKKIAQDSIYSVEKLRSTGIQLKWNLYNTFPVIQTADHRPQTID